MLTPPAVCTAGMRCGGKEEPLCVGPLAPAKDSPSERTDGGGPDKLCCAKWGAAGGCGMPGGPY